MTALYQIGIDIGGTFTDFVVRHQQTGETVIHKLPSTPADPSQAAVDGIQHMAKSLAVEPCQFSRVLHGTTIATNMILQKNGAKVGLITTEGFRDILHIGRKKRPLNFSHYQDVPRQSAPIIPRYLRRVVPERISAPDGAIQTPLDEVAVREALAYLADEGVDAIAVCFLFAFLNPIHERRVRDLAHSLCPSVFISLSHEVCALHREYERFSTTALNAYIGPATSRYTDRLTSALQDYGITTDVRLMTSAGGLISSRKAKEKPVSLVLSGPVGALIKGIDVGRSVGHPSVITLDVGGTSADVGVAPDGHMQMKHILDTQIGDYDAMVPMVDVATIGAGGGSIATVNEGGMFQVGPKSAGASPGPACYGLGGRDATVTDALVCLGWFRAETLQTSGMRINPELAHQAVRKTIAEPLSISVEQAALGIYRIVCKNMIDAIRLGSISKGYDPRDFALIAFGGAGAAFAAEIARELQIPTVLIPRNPGVGAAAGLLATDIKYEQMVSFWAELEAVNISELASRYTAMRRDAGRELNADGFGDDAIHYRYQADCRYAGQGYELTVEVPQDVTAPDWKANVAEAFHAAHERQYLRRFEENAVQLVNLRVTGIGEIAAVADAPPPVIVDEHNQQHTTMCIFADGEGWRSVNTAILNRWQLAPDAVIAGPVIIEQEDTTIVVPPDFSLHHHASGNLILQLNHEQKV